eukprot:3067547-Pleurochrysis_carterae.AAC.1
MSTCVGLDGQKIDRRHDVHSARGMHGARDGSCARGVLLAHNLVDSASRDRARDGRGASADALLRAGAKSWTPGVASIQRGSEATTIGDWGLLYLPWELTLYVLGCVERAEDLARCAETCRLLRVAARRDELWRSLWDRRWRRRPPMRLLQCTSGDCE